MGTGRMLAGAVVLLTGLLLAGCGSNPTAAPSSPATSPASGNPTPTSSPVVATGLVVSLDTVSVSMSDGSTGDTARFSDGPGTVALVSRILGSTPTPQHEDTYGFTGYDWNGVAVALNTNTGNSASVSFTVTRIGSINLSTAEGIAIGSAVADVRKVASPETEYESDSTHSSFGLEARTHPGTESLQYPGRVGKDYIDVLLVDGVVTDIATPGGDWQDI